MSKDTDNKRESDRKSRFISAMYALAFVLLFVFVIAMSIIETGGIWKFLSKFFVGTILLGVCILMLYLIIRFSVAHRNRD